MQDNQFALPQSWSKKRDEENSDASELLQEENQKLLLENAELKRKLEKEKLFHHTLYKQWSDLNASITAKNQELEKIRVRPNSQSPLYKYGFFGLLLITVILAVSAYNLSANGNKNTNAVQTIEQASPQSINQKPTIAAPALKQTNLSNKANRASPAEQPALSNNSEPSGTKITGVNPGKNTPGRYRIIAKSFFCNEPDANTRRNVFVLPDDSDYGIVTALDDRNGFIYIVFVNHAGRTSKGWISKSDLEQIN